MKPSSGSLLIRKTEAATKLALSGDSTGHDWWHTRRVWRMAARLARETGGADRVLVELSALLHDIGDWKFHGGDLEAGPRIAGRLLRRLGARADLVSGVQQVIREVTFKGAGVKDKPSSLEARIVQDSDRLDALGAIGIARTFAYGGSKGRAIYTPGEKPVLHKTFKAYKKSKSHSINHFYEKLLLLKGRLHTPAARRIAKGRDLHMREFLARFFKEWEGKA